MKIIVPFWHNFFGKLPIIKITGGFKISIPRVRTGQRIQDPQNNGYKDQGYQQLVVEGEDILYDGNTYIDTQGYVLEDPFQNTEIPATVNEIIVQIQNLADGIATSPDPVGDAQHALEMLQDVDMDLLTPEQQEELLAVINDLIAAITDRINDGTLSADQVESLRAVIDGLVELGGDDVVHRANGGLTDPAAIDTALDDAEGFIDSLEPERALDALESIDVSALSPAQRERYDALLASLKESIEIRMSELSMPDDERDIRVLRRALNRVNTLLGIEDDGVSSAQFDTDAERIQELIDQVESFTPYAGIEEAELALLYLEGIDRNSLTPEQQTEYDRLVSELRAAVESNLAEGGLGQETTDRYNAILAGLDSLSGTSSSSTAGLPDSIGPVQPGREESPGMRPARWGNTGFDLNGIDIDALGAAIEDGSFNESMLKDLIGLLASQIVIDANGDGEITYDERAAARDRLVDELNTLLGDLGWSFAAGEGDDRIVVTRPDGASMTLDVIDSDHRWQFHDSLGGGFR